MDEFIKIDIRQQLYKCFKVYGIEGTEQKINELYNAMPKLKETFLIEYHNILLGKKNEY